MSFHIFILCPLVPPGIYISALNLAQTGRGAAFRQSSGRWDLQRSPLIIIIRSYFLWWRTTCARRRECGNSWSDSYLHICVCAYLYARSELAVIFCQLLKRPSPRCLPNMRLVVINYLQKEALGPERPNWSMSERTENKWQMCSLQAGLAGSVRCKEWTDVMPSPKPCFTSLEIHGMSRILQCFDEKSRNFVCITNNKVVGLSKITR